jgi:hypothetical protein
VHHGPHPHETPNTTPKPDSVAAAQLRSVSHVTAASVTPDGVLGVVLHLAGHLQRSTHDGRDHLQFACS